MDSIKKKAKQLLVDADSLSLPIDLSKITEFLKIKLAEEVLPNEISGVLDTRDYNKPIILVNKNQSENRQRFSIAHEIGHFVLHHLDGKVHMDKKVFFRQDIPNKEDAKKEREANLFAAELLMPSDILLNKFVNHDSRVILEYWDNDDFLNQLAVEFKVSLPAMVIRLQELKLIPKV
ncbi:ImmA/IrrE family metallo-endopeptidase [Leptospira sp. GIMC2001]|uniref:ImmA/IrrE family metallo-endopeptidase n=1 Tax=Leptospira sp. GIMC2001 TaxID=1513297 RepID=UPI002349E40B|nr:ImmA/IrrE family metallo-endopeptidase [Leptospira sp. GIMC2001]WCL51257.1 ImmA/IrrE family metallo-endopeptidase [Leptospira sp. GIMC2001]